MRSNSCTVLHTVERSTHRFATISLYDNPRVVHYTPTQVITVGAAAFQVTAGSHHYQFKFLMRGALIIGIGTVPLRS